MNADAKQAKKRGEEFAPGVELVLDADGSYKHQAVDCFPDTWDIRPGGVWLWLADAGDSIRVGVYAPDDGGLVAPAEIVKFLTE